MNDTAENTAARIDLTVSKYRYEEGDADTHPALAVADKSGYSAFVTAWKLEYAGVTGGVRAAKRERKAAPSGSTEQYKACVKREEERVRAFNLIELRHAGKRQAAARYQATRQAEPALN